MLPPILLQDLGHRLVLRAQRLVQGRLVPPVPAVDVSMGGEQRAHNADAVLRGRDVERLRGKETFGEDGEAFRRNG